MRESKGLEIMNPVRNEESIFAAAIEQPTPEARAALLVQVCGDNVQLRAQVEQLIWAHEHPDSFLDATTSMGSAELPKMFDPLPDEPPGTEIGHYKLLEKVGEGGMGVVYLAEQTKPVRRRVALKIIKPGLDTSQVVARFAAEQQALALMNHPNIARVLDGGSTPAGRPFLVMEFVRGEPITGYCDREKLNTRQRLELFITVCQAVQHAHQKGVVHRDLKPSNVLVEVHDVMAVPKVIDFGVAKAIGQSLTDDFYHTGLDQVVGTPLYMSPEQAGHSSLDVDTRSDVYSLGVLLYEMLTGHTPFTRDELRDASVDELRRLICDVDPPRPSARVSTLQAAALATVSQCRGIEPSRLGRFLRGELDWIVMKSLEKDRSRRYESASGLARDVQRYLADEPVEARPPSTRYRLGKFLRRNKGPAIAVSAVLVALVAGIIGTTLALVRATTAEGLAKQRLEQVDAARAKAELAEDETMAAYRASTDEAIEKLIGSKDELGPQEKSYLESALQRWQEFASRQGDDKRSRHIRGMGHYQVGGLWQRLSQTVKAQAALEAAREIQEQLVEQFPAVPDYQNDLAGTHNDFGLLLHDIGKMEEAWTEWEAARGILKQLVEQFPPVPRYQSHLASVHNNLGNLLAELGKNEEAWNEFEAAYQLQKQLFKQNSAVLECQLLLALIHKSRGGLLLDLGKNEQAWTEFDAACGILKQLVEQFPVRRYQRLLGNMHNVLGHLLARLEKNEEAWAEFDAARGILKQLVEQFPVVSAYQIELAGAHHNLAKLLCDIGKTEEARAEYETALELLKQLVKQFPAEPGCQNLLASSHNNLGNLLIRLEKNEEAWVELKAACEIWKQLVEQLPAVIEYQIQLGGVYCNFGRHLSNEGNPAESLKWLDLAIQTLKLVHERNPGNFYARAFLRNSHSVRYKAYDRLEMPAEALTDCNRTIELSAPAEQAYHRARRAVLELHVGQIAEAAAEVAELTNGPNWPADEWYNFACVYAVASATIAERQQEYSDRAMECLTNAVVAGWTSAVQIANDSDFDPLREREDFKRLVRSLPDANAQPVDAAPPTQPEPVPASP